MLMAAFLMVQMGQVSGCAKAGAAHGPRVRLQQSVRYDGVVCSGAEAKEFPKYHTGQLAVS